MYKNLHIVRRALLRDVRGCPCVVRAAGGKRARSALSFCHVAQSSSELDGKIVEARDETVDISLKRST